VLIGILILFAVILLESGSNIYEESYWYF